MIEFYVAAECPRGDALQELEGRGGWGLEWEDRGCQHKGGDIYKALASRPLGQTYGSSDAQENVDRKAVVREADGKPV